MTGGRTITYRAQSVTYPLLSANEVFRVEPPLRTGGGVGEGVLEGTANVVHRIKSFTGTWSLRTGDVDYLRNGYVSGISGYHQPNPPTFMNKSNYVNMDIVYDEDYLEGNVDLALLTITGYGTNSGIQRILSGIN